MGLMELVWRRRLTLEVPGGRSRCFYFGRHVSAGGGEVLQNMVRYGGGG